MKHIIETCNENTYTGSTYDFYFDGMKTGVLDIETTGLNSSKNKFILGGLLNMQTGELHQCFAESRSEEKEALAAFLEEVSQLDMVVTYNGRHFDLPFMQKRMDIHGLTGSLPYNLDLYLVINGHSPIKKFVPNLKQKTVENYMGLWQDRTDEISGGESVELYNAFERTGDSELESKILLHNSDDVLQLARLLKVLTKCDVHRAMNHLGFPAGPLIVERIRMDSNRLTISGTQRSISIDYMGFSFGDWPVESRFDRRSKEFTVKLPVIRDSGLCFVDLEAAGLDKRHFEKYPSYGSGFLVLEDHGNRNFMEINHLIKEFLSLFFKEI